MQHGNNTKNKTKKEEYKKLCIQLTYIHSLGLDSNKFNAENIIEPLPVYLQVKRIEQNDASYENEQRKN